MYSGKTWIGSTCVNLKKECLQGNNYIPPPPLSLPLPLPSPTGRASCPIGGGPSPGTARWQEHSQSTAPASSSPVGGGGWWVVGGGGCGEREQWRVHCCFITYLLPPSSPSLPPTHLSLSGAKQLGENGWWSLASLAPPDPSVAMKSSRGEGRVRRVGGGERGRADGESKKVRLMEPPQVMPHMHYPTHIHSFTHTFISSFVHSLIPSFFHSPIAP